MQKEAQTSGERNRDGFKGKRKITLAGLSMSLFPSARKNTGSCQGFFSLSVFLSDQRTKAY